ncbi:RNA polymerase recycling motor HelD [Ammoniphilus resinae]|uniref:DNA helicase-2/ATP-dependent DNA helicase PcrA n=1 Tax=Ammoniphilus resinae TaxID=861532 RepID=A0ABS4GNA1_9BACL|nr:RNA polymerase recycling motor HelD [Ammoniphilus resinae]MBP1931748.1 DNA helicase-2/ATP-dependent DNA helicase PcrA [Ammoniphilus resinae]
MSISQRELDQEVDRLKEIQIRIQTEMGRLEEIVHYRGSEVLDIRRNFWDEVTVNTSDYYDLAETAASITQQQAVLSQEERSHRHALKNLRKLKRLHHNPYFARIDFIEKGEEAEKIYIGLSSLVDEDTHELLIYDWRAPISSLFYDYTPGPAGYQTPVGWIQGEMTLKRQYIIKNGILENMFDTGISIGDTMLQVLLARNTEGKMSHIVTTIQREQNQIIRDDQHEILIVQGAAGSGKTSVALQRVAYLLYKHRNSLTAEQMVLFSPNSLFNDYVSNVLPELGEANMLQTTFQEHLQRSIGKKYKVEDAYEQLEYLLSASEEDPAYLKRVQTIERKTSLLFMEQMDRYIEQLKETGIQFHDFRVRAKVLISKETLTEWFYHQTPADAPLPARMEKMKERALEELETLQERLFKNLFKKMLRNPKYLGTDEEMKAESRKTARKAFGPLRRTAKQLEFLDIIGMYHNFLNESSPIQEGIPYEDATPILYLKAVLIGWPTINQMKQVIVDEAQDYSPFQLRYIRRLFPRARFTLLGDLNQGIHHANVQSYTHLEELFGQTPTALFQMTKSYRSTHEIIEFTKGILQDPEPIETVGRSGDKPKMVAVPSEDLLATEIGKGVHELWQKGSKSIAIICKTESETRVAFETLKNKMDQEIHLITKETFVFKGGLVVIPAYLAKGLEFDSVIIYNVGEKVYHRSTERKLLYTACTRALHHLFLYFTGEPTPLIPSE